MSATLDDRITQVEHELAQLYQRRRERDQAVILLAILKVTDDWFTARELRALPLFAGKSAKSLGRFLTRIADDQDRSAAMPALRLLRHKTTTAATVWKVQTYPPACGGNGSGR